MNDRERDMIHYIAEGDMRRAQLSAKIFLEGVTAKKDEQFKEQMLKKLTKKTATIELPYNLQQLLVAEDVSNFPMSRFLLRDKDAAAVKKVLDLYRVSEQLAEMGIPYLPAMILHGESGCGKTMFARYIAHKADLPFVYVQFSRLVNSYLGKTQENLSRIFEYVRSTPCVLCFDEIDAIGMSRGQSDDIGEMNRVVIALMQEMDRLPNNAIIVGTTNRFDRLDPALVRRFPTQHQMMPLTLEEANTLAKKFFAYANVAFDRLAFAHCLSYIHPNCNDKVPASTVVKACTEMIVKTLIAEKEETEESKNAE